ncbi:hypothetical protein [uncultured Thalassospira sp.]|uniref:hypothetical protein n=1 Tax=uncultured Thalassospira sp. TaxID=404382 RepID=UPI0025909A43|nr:hypothetical protein [uncultured Thalassospira sp.]
MTAWPHYRITALRLCGVAAWQRGGMIAQPPKGHFVQATMIVITAPPRPICPMGPTGLMGAVGLIGLTCSIGLAGFCFLELPCDGGSLKIATHILF